LVLLDIRHPDVVESLAKLIEPRNPINDNMAENHICLIQDKEIHELSGMTGPKTGIVDSFWFEVELNSYRIDLNTLEERYIRLCGMNRDNVILELEESGHEIECVLIYVQAKWKNGSLVTQSVLPASENW
jgi:hypothetical protein